MIKSFTNWYRNLKPLKRLAVSFILNFLYWLTAWLIAEHFGFDEQRSWKYHVFHAIWNSFFMTILFNWKELKQIFKPQNRELNISEKDN